MACKIQGAYLALGELLAPAASASESGYTRDVNCDTTGCRSNIDNPTDKISDSQLKPQLSEANVLIAPIYVEEQNWEDERTHDIEDPVRVPRSLRTADSPNVHEQTEQYDEQKEDIQTEEQKRCVGRCYGYMQGEQQEYSNTSIPPT